jgi:hypothetical protein
MPATLCMHMIRRPTARHGDSQVPEEQKLVRIRQLTYVASLPVLVPAVQARGAIHRIDQCAVRSVWRK